MSRPVRPARRGDAPELRQLQSLLSEPSPQLLSAALAGLSTSRDNPTAGLGSWRVLVSPDTNDLPAGYLLALSGESTHIAELVVDPDHRREKRATTLLAALCDTAQQPVTVHVAADNSPARSLYRRVGFTEVSRSTDLFERSDGLTLRYDPESEVE